jgi:hypothetical protein
MRKTIEPRDISKIRKDIISLESYIYSGLTNKFKNYLSFGGYPEFVLPMLIEAKNIRQRLNGLLSVTDDEYIKAIIHVMNNIDNHNGVVENLLDRYSDILVRL